MAKKKKAKRFSAVKAVKEMARERIGRTPRARIIEDPKKKATERAKHRPTLEQLLREN